MPLDESNDRMCSPLDWCVFISRKIWCGNYKATRRFNAAKYGQGVKVCNIMSKNLFQLDAEAGDPAAVSQLGQCYDFGIGVEKSPAEALKWLKKRCRS